MILPQVTTACKGNSACCRFLSIVFPLKHLIDLKSHEPIERLRTHAVSDLVNRTAIFKLCIGAFVNPRYNYFNNAVVVDVDAVVVHTFPRHQNTWLVDLHHHLALLELQMH